ncbi:MAG: methyltransferase domain-containing protein [Xanthomonadales bacterium]|nr:methyltransferase domain-containing protein [Xanthomonadales bacterium]
MTSVDQPDDLGGEGWPYDATAEYYSTDMGSSMPFDDVGWYRELCRQRGGRVLELGCGSGRILLELLASGIDVTGIDRSMAMLRQLRLAADQRQLRPRVVQMDMRALCLVQQFDVILAPYSLITGFCDTREAISMLVQLRKLLTTNGCLVIDAFVPRPTELYTDFHLDYRRPHGDNILQREKRIDRFDDGCHRIFRRYTLLDSSSQVANRFTTAETIRPYSAGEIDQLAKAAELSVSSWHYDYGSKDCESSAQFATALLHSTQADANQ